MRRKLKRRKKSVNLDMDQLDDLLKRAESGKLQEKDVELIRDMAECIAVLSQAVDDKASSVKKLLRMVFGAKTEKKENVLKDKNDTGKEDNLDSTGVEGGRKQRPGRNNGRNSADKYTGAALVEVKLPEL